jgi:hypothetical protein
MQQDAKIQYIVCIVSKQKYLLFIYNFATVPVFKIVCSDQKFKEDNM